jgi:hypothetical protein
MLLFWNILKIEFITPDMDLILMDMAKIPYVASLLEYWEFVSIY